MVKSDALVRIERVTKRYGELRAVNDVSLEIEPGEIFALLGANGAGKTTLIGCITGLVMGFEGKIEIAGFDVVDDYQITRRLVGLVPQELNYDGVFTVRETLEFQAGYFGVKASREQVDELLDRFHLLDKANSVSRWLSGGMKRRLMICKALMHDPALLFLDEPTAGVDVDLRDEMWSYVKELRARGTTIVLTTHYLEEAEQLADRIGIINRGRLLRVDDRESLMKEYGQLHVNVTVGAVDVEKIVKEWEGQNLKAIGPNKLRLHYHEEERAEGMEPQIDLLLRELVMKGATIQEVQGGRSSLEEIYRAILRADDMGDEEGER